MTLVKFQWRTVKWVPFGRNPDKFRLRLSFFSVCNLFIFLRRF
nr:MAG TPA: hypothetical protein [Caudoviricetes sp.]